MDVKEKFNQKLLVEGNDDQHVLWALCEKKSINESFDVIDCRGYSELIKQIPVRFKQSGVQTLGIIVDADSDLSARWNAIKNCLNNLNCELPPNPPKEGFIGKVDSGTKFGVWLMPNNDSSGTLEDFMKFLIPNQDKLLPVLEEKLTEFEGQEITNYKSIHRSKAVIHSWLALQESPGTSLGLAITKRYLTIEEENCKEFVNWLNKLFNT